MNRLLHVPPSEENAEESLARAELYLEESRMAAAVGAYKISLNGAGLVWYHAAQALFFRDGIRGNNQFCTDAYLDTYVDTGDLEEEWLTYFVWMRGKRRDNQYRLGPDPTAKEVASGAVARIYPNIVI